MENANPIIFQRSGERLLTATDEDENVHDPIDDREIFDILCLFGIYSDRLYLHKLDVFLKYKVDRLYKRSRMHVFKQICVRNKYLIPFELIQMNAKIDVCRLFLAPFLNIYCSHRVPIIYSAWVAIVYIVRISYA